jgi:quinohemoprotein ethanol dehydrogenase
MAQSSGLLGWSVAAVVAAVIGVPLVGTNLSRETATAGPDAATPAAVVKGNAGDRLERAAKVDGARIVNADSEPGNWLAHGRTYGEQRFSPLDKINVETVKRLGPACSFATDSIRGMEATPIVVDGVAFVSATWSKVHAIDAVTCEELWSFDPEVPGETARKACCDTVNRGVAVWKGRVYVAALDGRLISLDARTGKVIWDIAAVDRTRPYTMTGAPRIVKDMVIIGNGGAELGVRGYITAFDTETGKQKWRFYTVPGDPSLPETAEHLKKAAATWKPDASGKKFWEVGGGGTAWDSMAYDPDLDLLYVGTGNGSPWSRYVRSPGGGDNLYVSSILAIKPDSGELAWYYQTTPGDTWDFTATQHMVLADLTIGGAVKKVLMQAPKNGFFYVLDRATGQLLSATAYAPMNWATGIDMLTGRPIENKAVAYNKGMTEVWPSPIGAHNWQPMSFNPKSGLVYIPVQEQPQAFLNDPRNGDIRLGAWNTGLDFAALGKALEQAIAAGQPPVSKGFLVGWDPVAQKAAWRIEHPTFWNGGTLTTAGGLVFQGLADGTFNAFKADTGEKLWSYGTNVGIIAAPVTYTVDGEQYIMVALGWGGVGVTQGPDPKAAINTHFNDGRIAVFKLDGKTAIETTRNDRGAMPEPPPFSGDQKLAEAGFKIFHRQCAVCHGFLTYASGLLPDLKWSTADTHAEYEDIVLGGKLKDRGMASFADQLNAKDVKAIQAYVLREANAAYKAQQAAPAPAAPATP